MLMRVGLELVPLVYKEVETFHTKCMLNAQHHSHPPSVAWKALARGEQGLKQASFRWINGNAPLAGLLQEHPDGDAWLVPIEIGEDILGRFEQLPGVEMAQHDAVSMVLSPSLPEDGKEPLTAVELYDLCLERVLFDCLPRCAWDTWRIYSECPSRMVPHIDAQDTATVARVLSVVASTPEVRDAAATLRMHCEAWNAKQPQDLTEVAAAGVAVLTLLGRGDEQIGPACHGLQGMSQGDFLERLLELDRSNQAFQCLSVLAGPRDTLQPHQLKMHAEAKRALFWHLDQLSTPQEKVPFHI